MHDVHTYLNYEEYQIVGIFFLFSPEINMLAVTIIEVMFVK